MAIPKTEYGDFFEWDNNLGPDFKRTAQDWYDKEIGSNYTRFLNCGQASAFTGNKGADLTYDRGLALGPYDKSNLSFGFPGPVEQEAFVDIYVDAGGAYYIGVFHNSGGLGEFDNKCLCAAQGSPVECPPEDDTIPPNDSAVEDPAAVEIREPRTGPYAGFTDAMYTQFKNLYKYTDDMPQEEGVVSAFNKYALFQYKGMPWNGNYLSKDQYQDSDSNTAITAEASKNPTAANLVHILGENSDNKALAYRYAWGDFLWARYYGKIPNNRLLTLRRFANPCVDNILDPIVVDPNAGPISGDQPCLAQAITWMGAEDANKIEDILKFSYGYNWEEIESEVQSLQARGSGHGKNTMGIGNTGFGMGSMVTSAQALSGGSSSTSARTATQNSGFDALSDTYPNHSLGPINVIQKMMIQKGGKGGGLNFEQEMELKFHYDLRAYGSANPKLAFLDLMSNVLVLTYNNAPFWGGATRYYGNSGQVGKPLGDYDKLAQGDIKGYMSSIVDSVSDIASNIFGDGNGGYTVDSVLEGIGDVAGDMLGGFLAENMHSPAGAQAAKAFLTGEPTGSWHLTVGNPLNPVALIGNLICTSSEISFNGPFSRDDFPSSFTLTVKVKPGRPRDKAEIESMFNAGRGRIYHPAEDFGDILALEPTEKGYGRVSGVGSDPWDQGIDASASNADAASARGAGSAQLRWADVISKEEYVENTDLGMGSAEHYGGNSSNSQGLMEMVEMSVNFG